MTILVNNNMLVYANVSLTAAFNTNTFIEIYEGSFPTESEMEQGNSAWHSNRSGDLLIQWSGAEIYRYNDAGQINGTGALRARIINLPNATTATKSGTGTWAAIWRGSTLPSIVGPVSTVGGDGIVIVSSLTFSTAGSPAPEYQPIDVGYRFTAV